MGWTARGGRRRRGRRGRCSRGGRGDHILTRRHASGREAILARVAARRRRARGGATHGSDDGGPECKREKAVAESFACRALRSGTRWAPNSKRDVADRPSMIRRKNETPPNTDRREKHDEKGGATRSTCSFSALGTVTRSVSVGAAALPLLAPPPVGAHRYCRLTKACCWRQLCDQAVGVGVVAAADDEGGGGGCEFEGDAGGGAPLVATYLFGCAVPPP